MIHGRDLLVRFGSVTALELPALDVDAGERLGLRGPNGSGKSTLLRVLAGLQALTSGSLSGLPPRGRITLVHQRPYFLRGTARDNVVYALRLSGRDTARADHLLAQVGAGHLADRRARALSGGEGRRVAIARALAVEPDVLLLDEPYAALDEEGTAAVNETLAGFGGTLLVAAPDLSPARVDRLVELHPASAPRP